MFVTGLLLLDAPASALNNIGNMPGQRYENMTGVKQIVVRGVGTYPYVAAQALRSWHRTTIEQRFEEWQVSPIYREEKIAYTEANPILYHDDDLFGYMRAPRRPTTRERAAAATSQAQAGEIETTKALTRITPFRLSTLPTLVPVLPTNDYGVMARQEGDPVPHEHQFYRGTLQGLYSLDLHASGTFYYVNRSGYRNLDAARVELAKAKGLEPIESKRGKAYRLPLPERISRIGMLLEGLAHLEGGAKLALHYTDVSPVVCIMAVTRGGNHLFRYAIKADEAGLPQLNQEALKKELQVQAQEICSPIYIGWAPGYRERQYKDLDTFAASLPERLFVIDHPWVVYERLIADLAHVDNTWWFA